MEQLYIVLILMAVIAALAPLAAKIKLPFPVALVVVGLIIGFIPGLPPVVLDPSIVFLIFLPPLLFEAAFNTSWQDFKAQRGPILFLAGRMVFLTTTVLAVIVHYCVPGFTWPLSFLLGAILSAPDAVAATAATKGLGLPRRVLTIIEGESLVNDAAALIAYSFALNAVAGHTFIFWKAWLQFILVAGGGVLTGLALGYIFSKVHKWLAGDPAVEISLTLLVGFVAYVTAEQFKTSGVLSVVTAGLFISYRSFGLFTSQTRLQMRSFWSILVFLLNGFVFILIGLQLPSILQGIGREHVATTIGYGLVISLAAILIRLIILAPLGKIFSGKVPLTKEKRRERRKELIIISWSGMRGVVSLATALALPLTLRSGSPFPERNDILLIAFVVILVTLVVQGLSFPYLVRRVGLKNTAHQSLEDEQQLRIELVNISLGFMESDLSHSLSPELGHKIKEELQGQLLFLQNIQSTEPGTGENAPPRPEILLTFLQAEIKVLHHQRHYLINLHRKATYAEDLLRKIELEMDIWNMGLQSRINALKTIPGLSGDSSN